VTEAGTVWSKILVALSGTDALEQPALQRALALAEKEITELDLLQVVYDSSLESYPLMPRDEDYFDVRDMLVQRQSAGLERIAETLQWRGYTVRKTVVWDSPTYQAIARRAAAMGANLVVCESLRGTKGRGLANADWRLITVCPAPLLIVKSTETGTYQHVAAAIDPFQAHDKPAALDEVILSRAAEIARTSLARLSAIYCFVPMSQIVGSESRAGLSSPEVEAELEQASKAAIINLVSKQGIDLDAAHVLRGTPSEMLPRFVANEAVDLLVMGALSRGRLAELIIGTTAADVLDSAECDLLVVKPAEFSAVVAEHLRPEPLTARSHPI
jgi:universal stress protein E